MFTFIIVIITIIALLITLVVLVQSGKGGGLAGIAAGGATQQVLGARQAPDFLEKATWMLATAFILLCILSNFVIDSSNTAPSSVIQERAQQEQAAPGEIELPGALPPAGVETEAPAAPATGGEGGSGNGDDSGSDG